MKLLALLFFIGAASAQQFVAQFLFEEIANPDNKILAGTECDYYDVFGRFCDMKLQFCCEDLKDSAADWTCRTGWRESNIIASDQDDDLMYPNTFYGDLPNPVRYLGTGNYIGIRLKIRIWDANFGNAPDSLIDQWQQTITLPVGTHGHEFSITHARPNLQPTKVRFQYSIDCQGSTPCGATTTTTPPTTTTPTAAPCNLNSVQFDIAEITDVSSNMGSSNYAAVKSFLKSWLQQFTIGTGSGQTEFSSGYYGRNANAWLLFYQQTYSGVTGLIDRWPYQGGSSAVLDSGLNDENIVYQRSGYRQSSKHLVIVFGPGVNTGSNTAAINFANNLRTGNANALVVAVAVGSHSPNLSLLNQIAGSSSNVLRLSSSSQLSSVAGPWLNAKVCSKWNS